MQGSARLDRGRNGSPAVVNINNSQNNPVVSNQTTTVKAADAVRSNEPSFLQTAYGALAGVFN